jgi:hypothetical protein
MASRDHAQLVIYSSAVVCVTIASACVDARSSRYPPPPPLRSYHCPFSCFRVPYRRTPSASFTLSAVLVHPTSLAPPCRKKNMAPDLRISLPRAIETAALITATTNTPHHGAHRKQVLLRGRKLKFETVLQERGKGESRESVRHTSDRGQFKPRVTRAAPPEVCL